MANPDNVSKTLLQTFYLSRQAPHNFLTNPFPYFQSNSYPIFMLEGGQYISDVDWINLNANDMHHFRIGEDGRLLVDTGTAESSSYTVALENNGAGDPIYIGEASPGTVKADAGWRIQLLTYAAGDLVDIQWASGNANFDKIWNNRAGYIYS